MKALGYFAVLLLGLLAGFLLGLAFLRAVS